MSEAIHWTRSRVFVRDAACSRDEGYIERQFSRHNDECQKTECPLKLLDDFIMRYVQFSIVGESTEIILLSPFVEKS